MYSKQQEGGMAGNIEKKQRKQREDKQKERK